MLSNKHGWSLYQNHFTHPPQPQLEPAQRAAYCPTNMHCNENPLLLWWDVVAQHVVARYKENMYLFKCSKPAPHVIRGVVKVALPNTVVCIKKFRWRFHEILFASDCQDQGYDLFDAHHSILLSLGTQKHGQTPFWKVSPELFYANDCNISTGSGWKRRCLLCLVVIIRPVPLPL